MTLSYDPTCVCIIGVTISLLFLGIGFQVETAYSPDSTLSSIGVADVCAHKYQ